MLTVEDLMKPRYKVIADFPGNQWKVGQILLKNDKVFKGDGYSEEYKLEHFPHLFKKLEWFEERKTEDMPEYVKPKRAPEYVFKVIEFHSTVCEYFGTDGRICMDNSFVFDPATPSEYISYINKQK